MLHKELDGALVVGYSEEERDPSHFVNVRVAQLENAEHVVANLKDAGYTKFYIYEGLCEINLMDKGGDR